MATTVNIDVREATRSISELTRKLSHPEFLKAQSRAINYTLAIARTKSSAVITSRYKISAANAKKSLRVKRASPVSRYGAIMASSAYTPMHYFGIRKMTDMGSFTTLRKGVLSTSLNTKKRLSIKDRKRINRIEVEIVKGQRRLLPSAFFLNQSSTMIAARGVYTQGTDFAWRNKRVVSSGPDKPIDVLQSPSIFKQLTTDAAMQQVQKDISPKYQARLLHEVNFILSKM
jgi:hypothetical protein